MATAEPAASARPLPEYAAIAGAFSAVLAGFLVLARNRIPERVGAGDVARVGLASYKIGRLVAKDEITTWVRAPVTRDEEAQKPEREGMARALGELVTCPYCIGLWVSAGLTGALVVRPRETRVVTTIFGAQAVADFANAAFVRVRGSS